MNRIFVTLAVVSNVLLMVAFALGYVIEDAAAVDSAARQAVTVHFLTAIAATMMALLVHAIVLTYFMGTGRWIEETSTAYRLDDQRRAANVSLKYRTLPGMIACVLLLIVTSAFGAIADPGSDVQMAASASIHFALAIITLLLNVIVSVLEYDSLRRNGQLVQQVLADVACIRHEHGVNENVDSSFRSTLPT